METPLIFTLFGSTGDLAQKKIMPALFTLYIQGRLPKDFTIVAFSRRAWNDKNYHDFIMPSLVDLPQAKEKLKHFLEHVVYTEGQFTSHASHESLKKCITKS